MNQNLEKTTKALIIVAVLLWMVLISGCVKQREDSILDRCNVLSQMAEIKFDNFTGFVFNERGSLTSVIKDENDSGWVEVFTNFTMCLNRTEYPYSCIDEVATLEAPCEYCVRVTVDNQIINDGFNCANFKDIRRSG